MASVVGFRGNALDPATTKRLATSTLVEGRTVGQWWGAQSRQLREKFSAQVRISMQNGESIQQAAARISGGTIDGATVPGVMKTSRNHAKTLVRTSINKVTNEARLATFKANSDVIKGVVQISSLDGRTTDICIAYSGETWDLETLEPIPPSRLPFNGGPPRHFNCRSTLAPVTKSLSELGLSGKGLKEIPPGTRASMDGQVPADISFGDFLRGKSRSFQDNLLGKGRADLWRDGKITLKNLVDQQGRPMSLAQLEQKVGAKKAKRKAATPAAVEPATREQVNNSFLMKEGQPESVLAAHEFSYWEGASADIYKAYNHSKPLGGGVKFVGDGAHYMPLGRNSYISMKMSVNAEKRRKAGTWRHEWGHHVDYTELKRADRLGLMDIKKVTFKRPNVSSHWWGEASEDTRAVLGRNQMSMKGFRSQKARDFWNLQMKQFQDRSLKLGKEARDKMLAGDDKAWKEILDKRWRKLGYSFDEFDHYIRTEWRFADDFANKSATELKHGTITVHADAIAALEENNAFALIDQVFGNGGYFYRGDIGKINDFFAAATNNRFGYGHSNSYFAKGIEWRSTEMMANIWSAKTNANSQVGFKIIKQFFPKFTAKFEKLYDDMVRSAE